MKEIQLTKGMTTKVDDADYEWLSKFKWCVNNRRGHFYAVRGITVNGKRTLESMHRAILGCDASLLTDHADGDTLNNQRENLRPCTHAQNMMNKKAKKNGTSRYKGVSLSTGRGKYRATIQVDKKVKHLGSFALEIDAATAYNAAATTLFGSFAKLNIIAV